MRITILHQDGDCVAVMKPAGMASVPEKAGDAACLSARLACQLRQRVYPVHRLDKPVDGVMLYALNAPAHQALCLAFERHQAIKTYLAVVHGRPAADQGVIDLPLRIFGSGRTGVDALRGKASQTRYTVIERGEAFSLLQLQPASGRRHQLRVHLYSLGHPIAGDPDYGPSDRREGHPRLMLTAIGLSLTLPSGHRLDIADQIADAFRLAARDRYGLHPNGAPTPT